MHDSFPFHLPGFSIETINQMEHGLVVFAHSQATSAACPDCQTCSTQYHSSYERTLSDVPCSGHRVTLRIRIHRFFCRYVSCRRRTFAESIEVLAPRFARRTSRLTSTFEHLALALGGEAGSRLASMLALPCSPSTLIRCALQLPLVSVGSPRVIGIDDWAWRKGQRYGTLICDLEQHRPIELLKDRTVASTVQWLQHYPSIEIISRDRGGTYAEAARLGAPQAVQVADRWHLLQNVGDALEVLLTHHLTALRKQVTQSVQPTSPPSAPTEGPVLTSASRPHETRRQARLARYEQVVTLAKEGMRTKQIAQTVGIGATTIERWLAAGTFPERQERVHDARPTPPWLAYALKRWQEDQRSLLAIHRELQVQGYQGSYWSVYSALTPLRETAQRRSPTLPVFPLSARKVRWLFLQRPSDLTQEQQEDLRTLGARDPELERVYDLIQQFVQMVRTHTAAPLPEWLKVVEASPFTELHPFVRGVRQDQAAVKAGLNLPWSQGQTEGQITRLKLIKRQMYGRAHFDLLRRRVLLAA